MKDVVQKMRQRLEDPDATVASAALSVSLKLLEVRPQFPMTEDDLMIAIAGRLYLRGEAAPCCIQVIAKCLGRQGRH